MSLHNVKDHCSSCNKIKARKSFLTLICSTYFQNCLYSNVLSLTTLVMSIVAHTGRCTWYKYILLGLLSLKGKLENFI